MPPEPPDFVAGGQPPPPPPAEGGSGTGQAGSGQAETRVASGQSSQSGRLDMRSLMESIFKKLEDAVSAT